jgi:hypothetical protein
LDGCKVAVAVAGAGAGASLGTDGGTKLKLTASSFLLRLFPICPHGKGNYNGNDDDSCHC